MKVEGVSGLMRVRPRWRMSLIRHEWLLLLDVSLHVRCFYREVIVTDTPGGVSYGPLLIPNPENKCS